jgi:hypothetical protein
MVVGSRRTPENFEKTDIIRVDSIAGIGQLPRSHNGEPAALRLPALARRPRGTNDYQIRKIHTDFQPGLSRRHRRRSVLRTESGIEDFDNRCAKLEKNRISQTQARSYRRRRFAQRNHDRENHVEG